MGFSGGSAEVAGVEVTVGEDLDVALARIDDSFALVAVSGDVVVARAVLVRRFWEDDVALSEVASIDSISGDLLSSEAETANEVVVAVVVEPAVTSSTAVVGVCASSAESDTWGSSVSIGSSTDESAFPEANV